MLHNENQIFSHELSQGHNHAGNVKTGRNDPCPCGSGKKFKKCCFLGENALETKTTKQYPKARMYSEIDYGTPKTDNEFFTNNSVHDISSARMMYSVLLEPGIESAASKLSKFYFRLIRGTEEKKKIEKTKDVRELIDIMSSAPDMLNYEMLIGKILNRRETALPLIFEALNTGHCSDSFVEIAARILHRAKIDYSKQIIEVLKNNSLDVYQINILCVLLGFYDNPESVAVLWNYFHYFKANFPHDTLSDGPLLGMIEIEERKKDLIRENGGSVLDDVEVDDDVSIKEGFCEDGEFEKDAQDERIETVLGTDDIAVSRKLLNVYDEFLRKNLKLPCRLTGGCSFEWEDKYILGYGDDNEYNKMRKQKASHLDHYDLSGFVGVKRSLGVVVSVKRVSDNKNFELPLADLEIVDKQAENYQIVDDYGVWFTNN